jgi:hypothetical protein
MLHGHGGGLENVDLLSLQKVELDRNQSLDTYCRDPDP